VPARRRQSLADLGVRLALDDFKHRLLVAGLPAPLSVRRLKIGRSFVAGLGRDQEDEAIVTLVVAMGRRAGPDLILEGIETETQALRLGCRFAQGYHFGRPSSPEHLGRRSDREAGVEIRGRPAPLRA
jgi:EAL domain-containing protein (putative c-di-GMP-specific phosphodiesterase class I)